MKNDDGAQAVRPDGPERPAEPGPARKTRTTPAVAQAPAPEVIPIEGTASYVPAVISTSQRRRFFAIAREHGWMNDQLKPWLQTYGIESTREIPTQQYDALCDALTLERPGANRAPGEDDG
jgi:hypothetical protein